MSWWKVVVRKKGLSVTHNLILEYPGPVVRSKIILAFVGSIGCKRMMANTSQCLKRKRIKGWGQTRDRLPRTVHSETWDYVERDIHFLTDEGDNLKLLLNMMCFFFCRLEGWYLYVQKVCWLSQHETCQSLGYYETGSGVSHKHETRYRCHTETWLICQTCFIYRTCFGFETHWYVFHVCFACLGLKHIASVV